MKRNIINQLVKWKTTSNRMPLLLRGARQTGKTYIVEWFGRKYFDEIVTVNFELNPELRSCFTKLEPTYILQQLEVLTGKKIIAGKHLLFLDEIQECPEAIQALRYFKEKLPELHVIGAGSLLEFVLVEPKFSLPVGRVECLYLYPLCFAEFLMALGEESSLHYLSTVSVTEMIPEAVHHKLLELLRIYLIVGGMPAAVQSYIDDRDLTRVQQLQAFILNTYRNDFGKYASEVNQQHCRRLFERVPYLISKQFKYVDVDPDVQSRSLKTALKALTLAGILFPIYSSQAQGLPLNASIDEKKFKLLFLDTGLVKYSAGVTAQALLRTDLLLLNSGAIAEQFVGQELIAHQANYDEPKLYFWQRHKKSSSAEVDYLIQHEGTILPIEVKSGKTGRLKSLQILMSENAIKLGVKISQSNLAFENNILSVPLYMIGELARLASQIQAQDGL